MKSSMIRSSLAFALAAMSVAATAADNGFYAYGSAGWTESQRKSQADATITNSGITAFSSHGDESDTGYKLQAGYRFNRFLAVEAGYVNLGKYTYDAASTAPIVATRNGNVKAEGWTAGAAASLPVAEQIALFAKLGALNYSLKYHCAGTGIACVDPDRNKNGTVMYYGAGADWNFAGNWFARAEYEVFQDVGSRFNANGTTGTSKADIKMGSLGIGYRF